MTNQPGEVVAKYLACLGEHDVPAALGYLSEGFQLEFKGGPTLGKEGLATALGWDTGTEGRLEWRVVSGDGGSVTIEGHETNEFLRLLGIQPLEFGSRFRVNAEGLIQHQTHTTNWSGVSVQDSLAPVIAWAADHAAAELTLAYPDGEMVYSEEAGRRWVALLRRWRGQTTDPDT